MLRLTTQQHETKPSFDEPSRAELKRRMDRLQDLGKRLVELPAGKLARMTLPDKLQAAVTEARRLTAMGAKRRQLQYIGRIMEEFDTAAIARDLRDIDQAPTKSAADIESITDAAAIIAGGDDVLYATYGDRLDAAGMQRFRQALRLVRKEIAEGGDTKSLTERFAKICVQN